MDISRRILLKVGAMCAAGAIFPASRYASLLDAIPPANVRLSLATFSPRRNETFKLSHQGRAISLKLVEIRNLITDRAYNADSGECFSLLFRGSSKAPLKQGTYRLRHPKLGAVALFVVPVNQPLPDGGAHYEAIINRMPRQA